MGVGSHWEHFPHGADIGIRGVGSTLNQAFAMGAKALTAIVTDPQQVQLFESFEIHCEAPDLEILFCDWINALIFEMDTRRIILGRFQVNIEGMKLRAMVWGEALDSKKRSFRVEPKGATMTELSVKKDGDFYITQCVVDV